MMPFVSTRKSNVLIGVCALLLAACASESYFDQQRAAQTGAAANWPDVGGNADESSFSQLRDIDVGNIERLGLAWALDLPGEGTLEATPIAVDGVLYFTGSYADVYAVDVSTGALLWKYEPQTWKVNPRKMNFGLPVNRGAAYAAGRVFVGALDGRLIALDARSGEVLWSVDTIPAKMFNVSTGAPRVFNDLVIIGNSGADFGARGFVTAYDQATGEQRWRFYTVPGRPEDNQGDPAMERAAQTWSGKYWITGTGGTVWNGMTFDRELNQIYIGVGNGGPYDPSVRSPGDGDNLYLASVVALDAATGRYVWHYQANPREGWDYKSTANMIATTLTIGGEQRKVLLQAPTNGFFYVLDRQTGKLISAEKTGKVNWASHIDLSTGRPVEAPNLRYETGEVTIYPGSLGGHNWQAMSYSPLTGLVYIPYMQLGSRYVRNAAGEEGGFAFRDLTLFSVVDENDPGDGKGALLAWDPVAQKLQWKVQHPHVWNGGTLVTAGDVVFQGTADGWFSAYEAKTGEQLWRFNAGHGIIGAPMSYAVDGRQYVSILVGYGGSAAVMSEFLDVGWKYAAQPRRLLTFSLDGNAVLPPGPPADLRVNALDDLALELDEADIAMGNTMYNTVCSSCHGLGLRAAGGPAPDLRESAIALQLESFSAVLLDGALMSRGMPGYQSYTPAQVRQLHAYVRAGAREALGVRSPATGQVGAGGL
jgi:quinohemoprotein ethanol dehydrogenase